MLPAGRYYIGDPCYVIAEDNWDSWLDVYWQGEGELAYNGLDMYAHRTAYGDGLYRDQLGRKYGVDAGMLGAVPIALCDKDPGNLGHFFDFDKPFECDYEDGLFTFGHIQIQTGDDEDEDDSF